MDEYVSSDEDAEENVAAQPNKIVEENKDENGRSKKNDMIFKPFKPGKCHAGMRQFPQSVQELKAQQPMSDWQKRKLPADIKELQRKREDEMR